MKNRFRAVFALIPVVLFCCSTPVPPEEHSPERSLADLKVYPGLNVSLFASEPMFSNPTNMDIDARGRVWITEAYNYRNQYNPKNPVRAEGDRIVILEDTDGDGKADKSKVFYQGTDINAALGIGVFGNKVIVSCSPHVFVFTDEDGDDVPDKKEILFQGIRGVQHDHAIHAFTFGHDGKFYFNMGNEGGLLIDAKGDTVRDIYGNKVVTDGKPYRQGLAMRCDIDGSNVEVLGHNFRNNYELAADPYGTVWQSDNDDDGNKGTRINYVMEFGNFGYRDEMTGASWNARRTNMEKEIPFRHWHLNDPGVVPNMLQTGSGSPTGILCYEGDMLPKEFYGQLIHAEPGHNVIRSYIVENDGAGYKASTVNILEGRDDQWFRPADVTVAPDGSLFVADWYDPGVGGHQVGDLDKGRIYRITKGTTRYKVEKPDLSNAEGAVRSLTSPNVATRFLAYQALQEMGPQAESALVSLWNSANPRSRAQALWLLAKLPDGNKYLHEALRGTDDNIVIATIRASRMLGRPVLPIATELQRHASSQVRRELALAIRGDNSKEAADIWASLAMQYDGQDRWYLEALGISAALTWDRYFDSWLVQAGDNWKKHPHRDIVWRSRSKAALPLLAELIRDSDETEMLRYYRAFDFHSDPSKQVVLSSLVTQTKGNKVLYALKHMDASQLKMTPAVSRALNVALDEHRGSLEFVELVSIFKLQARADDLIKLAVANPDSVKGKEAMRTLLDWSRLDLIRRSLNASQDEAAAAVKTVRPHMNNAKAIILMEELMLDENKDLPIRQLAVKSFGGPWEAEDHLLRMAEQKRIPETLHGAAAGVFQTAWRATLRDEAAKYLNLPGSSEGTSLPKISELADMKGNVRNGREVFTNLCSNCHQVNGEGVNFGPDLSEIGTKLSREALYTSILYPDQGISFGYEGFRIRLNDGSTVFGRIVSETAEKVDIQFMTQQQSVDKSAISSRIKMDNSLMPANLQASMSKQELVDLVEFLAALRK
jgi:putative membrane-bound dehydrogenase-like protein